MLRTILAILVTTLLAVGAHATQNGDNNCRGNCPSNQGGEPSTIDLNQEAAAVALAGSLAGSQSDSESNSAGLGVGIAESGDSRAEVTTGDTIINLTTPGMTDRELAALSSDTGDHVEVNETSTTTNINDSDYIVPAHASAGVAFAMLQGCYGIGGADVRGSGSQSAGGLTLNIFKLTNDRCVLAAKALEAQANGNLEGYATMTCADSATWKAYRTVMSAKANRSYFNRVRKNDAINHCVIEIKAVALAMSVRITQVEATLNEITQLQAEGYDDAAIRARLGILEGAAHRPDSRDLIVK